MQTRIAAVVAAGASAFIVASTAPAHAADTDVTFALTSAGALAVTAPTTADLGSAATTATSISGNLGTVSVTDERSDLVATWSASVTLTDFTTGPVGDTYTVPAANVLYSTGVITTDPVLAVALPGVSNGALSGVLPVATVVTVGDNSATWDPTVTVNLAGLNAPKGTYSGTITHSVS